MAKPTKPTKDIVFTPFRMEGCPELMDLEIFVPQGANAQDFKIGAEIRFGTMTIAMDDYSKKIEFGLTSATLQLNFSGCRPAIGTRLGDVTTAPTKNTVTKKRETSSGVSGELGVGGKVIAPRGKAAASAEVKNSETVKTTQTQIEEPIVALSGNRWKFSAIGGSSHMRSKYSGDETLCEVNIEKAEVAVNGNLGFFPRDLVFLNVEDTSNRMLSGLNQPNKSALAKVLLAKHLKHLNSAPESQMIVGASAVVRAKVSDE